MGRLVSSMITSLDGHAAALRATWSPGSWVFPGLVDARHRTR